jgi:glucokinase
MTSVQQAAVGVDLGGTMARAGLITPHGKLFASTEIQIEAREGPQAGIDRLIRLIEQLTRQVEYKLVGIGIGATGPLDIKLGKIHNPYTLPGWEDVNVATPLTDHFQVPVYLENDADAAALGEYWMGAGQAVKRLVAVTVGTGVGMAAILDGKIYRGIDDCHPEGGHMLLDPNGPVCYCGANGCWESFCSGPAIVERAKSVVKNYPDQTRTFWEKLPDEEWTAALVIDAARRSDSLAIDVVDRAAFYMGLGIVNVINILAPEKIVLSGGVMKSLDLFIPSVRQAIQKNNQMVPAKKVQVLPAALGYYAGVYGGAYRVYQHFEQN